MTKLFRSSTVGLVALVVLAAGVLVAPGAEAVGVRRTVTLRQTATASGEVWTTVHLTGRVTRSPKRSRVRIERKVGRNRWKIVRTARTVNRRGTFRTDWVAPRAGSWVFRARVTAVRRKGVTRRAAKSRAIRVTVVKGGWAQVSTSANSTCAIDFAGRLFCWGDNSDGELGINTLEPVLTPTRALANHTWVSVSTHGTTCAIDSTRALWCWGNNRDGLLGPGSTALMSVAPVRVGTANDWRQVAVTYQTVCGVRDDNSAWCWGRSTDRANNSSTIPTDRMRTPQQVPGAWASMNADGPSLCGLQTDSSLWCWGSNTLGQVGNGTTTAVTTPYRVGGSATWRSYSSSGAHTCGVSSDGSLWCWGSNDSYQLGDGTTNSHTVPTRVGTANDWTTVTTAFDHTCAQRTDTKVLCWGFGYYGLLGDGSATQVVRTPTELPGVWKWFRARSYSRCGIRPDDSLWCWGSNDHGQIGNGTIIDTLSPEEVPVPA